MDLHLRPSTDALKFYQNSNNDSDSRLDLYIVHDIRIPARSTKLIDLEVAVEARQISTKCRMGCNGNLFVNKSMLLVARDNIYKTPLRLANGVVVIDSCHRDSIKVPIDNINDKDFFIRKGDRIVQLVAANLECFNLVILSCT